MQTDPQQHGDMPTTGAARPGPVSAIDRAAPPAGDSRAQGERPIALRIPVIQVDAEVERAFIEDDVMQDPSGPFVIAWYGETRRVGVPGNAVFSGHVDYVDVGPAVFARVGELVVGDTVEIVSSIGGQFVYSVDWNEIYPATEAPVADILRQSDAEEITLITCGGAFDPASGLYSDRRIVRASRVS